MADAPVGWERLSSAFDLVISLPTGERASFMATTYGSDAAFRAELESLVAAHDGATAFLDELHAEIIQPALAHDDQLDARVANVDADTRADGVAPGDRIRHFVVHERIGSGGAGIVYRGRDTLLERDVAIKVLAPTVSQDPVARARLVREAQAASRLDDPHVCAIHAIESTADGGLCIVMAFCAGGTLRERLRRGVIPIDDVMTIATHLARGLASAHQAGIVHGDIKPANVGFGEGDVARLLDFGVAILDREPTSPRGPGLVGTLPYLAPELWRGASRSVHADVWALGITFFEMVVGRRPFTGADPDALATAILSEPLPPLVRPDGSVPSPAFGDLIRRMLSPVPQDRPADGSAVLAALRAMSPTPIAMVRPTDADAVAAAPQPQAGPHTRWPMQLAAFTVVAALGVAAWRVTQRPSRSETAPRPVEVARTNAPLPTIAVLPFTTRGGRDIDYLREGMVDLLTPAFDGTGLVRGIDPNTVIGAASGDRSALLDSASARAWAVRVKADRYVVGSLVRAGTTLSFRASLRSIDGREIGRAQTTVSDTAGLSRGVDAVVRQLIASALLAPADTVAGIAATTTTSPQALRAFLDGERELRDARPAAAVEQFQAAVAADSLFALAWYRLARAARWSEVDSLSTAAARRAYALAGTLPQRQQAIIRAYHDLRFGSVRAAERQLVQMVRDYPTDIEGWMLLGELQFGNNPYHGRSIQESMQAFQTVMALDPRNREVTVYLMDLAASADMRGKLDTLYSMYFSPNSAGEQPGIRAAYTALFQRRIRGTSQAALPADLRNDPAVIRVGLQRISPDLRDRAAARTFARALAATQDAEAEGLRALATLDVADGRWTDGASRFRAAEALDPARGIDDRAFFALAPTVTLAADSLRALRDELAQRRATAVPSMSGLSDREHRDLRDYLVGMLGVRLRDSSGVTAALRSLRSAPAERSRLAAPLHASLTAHWKLMAGDVVGAVASFEQASLDIPARLRAQHPVLGQHLDRLARAECLRGLGRPVEAQGWYRSLLEGTGVIGTPFFAAADAGRRRTAAP